MSCCNNNKSNCGCNSYKNCCVPKPVCPSPCAPNCNNGNGYISVVSSTSFASNVGRLVNDFLVSNPLNMTKVSNTDVLLGTIGTFLITYGATWVNNGQGNSVVSTSTLVNNLVVAGSSVDVTTTDLAGSINKQFIIPINTCNSVVTVQVNNTTSANIVFSNSFLTIVRLS